MFAFTAVPNERHCAMPPADFARAAQLHLRLPLALLAGATTCECGAVIDCDGTVMCICILSCRACTGDRTLWHGLITDVVARISQTANMHVPHSARRPRVAPLAYVYPPD